MIPLLVYLGREYCAFGFRDEPVNKDFVAVVIKMMSIG